MATEICMNELCRATTSCEWKKGWGLKSGGYAMLCQSCGSTFENFSFCVAFHSDESGWRDCRICGKRIHCGCVASRFLYEFMDFGGIGCVGCVGCVKHAESHSTRAIKIPGKDINNGTLASNSREDVQPVDTAIKQLSKSIEVNEPSEPFLSQKHDTDVALRQLRREKPRLTVGEGSSYFANINQHSAGGSLSFSKPDNSKPKQGIKGINESLGEPSLNFALSTPICTSSTALPLPGGVEAREQKKGSSSQQGQRTRHILPKPPKSAPSTISEANTGTPAQARVARPPAEGRGRNQLLPRYWPRITDQELQQISGDLNSTIIPLFEKVLSPSDAGRIGRLVLPKACAEAYFPPISQSEGVPIKIQDIKGKEWTFQFRFWPNNNSRMYVLEGVTPCIQNMQLEAGDTVTFSRIDPGGKLVMGFRKATNNNDTQDAQTNTLSNGNSSETTFAGANENSATNGGRTSDEDGQRHMLVLGKKKIRNIGSKNKRLLIHSEDSMELRVTWREAQELLRPSPTAQPRMILIEDYEIEEYDVPPIFGKKTIFTVRPTGEQEQWGQCDGCSRWRKLPVNVLLPANWSCSDNVWGEHRYIHGLLVSLGLHFLSDLKRQRITESRAAEVSEPSGLDALATAAVLGDNFGNLGETSVGPTTKHPRHRVGCSCIVCIQPPSGKGKHLPSCKCNVCQTVKRRFKTMMLRKKKRKSEREAELTQEKDQPPAANGSDVDKEAGQALLQMNHSENNVRSQNENQMEVAETSKGQL